MGEWFPIPGPPYWQYDAQAPDPDPTVTSMLPVYAAGDVAPVITPQVTSPADTTSTAPVPPVDNESEVERLRPRSDLDRR